MTKKLIEVAEDGNPTGRILFQFDDHTAEVPSVRVFDMAQVPEAMKFRLAIHGASQKTGDSYANAAKESDPLAFAKSAVEETIAQLYAGTWRVNAGGGPRVNDLAVAIARATGQELEGEEGAIAFVAAMSDEDKKVWRGKTAIKAKLAEIALEKATKKAADLAAQAAKEAEEEKAKAAAAGTPATA